MKTRVELSLVILCGIFFSLVLSAWGLSGVTMGIFETPLAVLKIQTQTYPLLIGQVPFSLVLLAIALVMTDLINEYHGLSMAILVSIAGGLALLLFWAMFTLLPSLPYIQGVESWSGTHRAAFDLSRRFVLGLSSAVVAGFTTTAIFFELARKLTRNFFSPLRLAVAHVFGSLLAAGTPALLMHYIAHEPAGQMLAFFLTRLTQWIALSWLASVFYYVFKPFLRVVVGGEHAQSIKTRYGRKKALVPEEPPRDFFAARNELLEKRI